MSGAEGVDVVYNAVGGDYAEPAIKSGGRQYGSLNAVGGDYAEPAIRALAWTGRFLVVGFPAGIPKIPLNLTLLKGSQIVGVFWGASVFREPQGHAENMAELFQMYADGRIKPCISARFRLEEVPEALTMMMERKVMGKIVVTLS